VMKPLGECPLVYPSGLGVLESDRTGDDIFNVQPSMFSLQLLVPLVGGISFEVEYEKVSDGVCERAAIY